MAVLTSVLGKFNKSMGGVTFSNWKGKNVAKQKVPAQNTSNTPAQAAQRRRFALVAALAGQWGESIRVGYRMAATTQTEQNVFTSKNYAATTDDGTKASVNYALLEISSGAVGSVQGLTAHFDTTTGLLSVEWTDNSNGAEALPTDQIYLLAVNPITGDAATNATHTMRADAPTQFGSSAFIGAQLANIRVYAFFKRANSTAASPTATAIAVL